MMEKRFNVLQRMLSAVICLAMLFSLIPAVQSAVTAVEAGNVDASTMDSWKGFFDPANVSTEHAGGIWTDKSVFNSAAAFPNMGIALQDQSNFLVALSALAANSIVVGQGSTPTDTMFVLDISGSMSSSEINAMIAAANNAIRTLHEINEENRVGIVLYSDEAEVLLKPDRYTGVKDADNVEQFIRRGATISYGRYEYESNSYISTVTGLKNSSGQAVNKYVELAGGTYIQGGLWAAWEEFDALSDTASTARTPVMVLMSDGAPTFVTNDYASVPGVYEYGEGDGSMDGDGFVTQLTAAYVKEQLAAKYGTTPYFYTLGLGVDNVTDSQVAIAVLDTSADSQTKGINDYWTTFNSLKNAQNKTMRVTLGNRNSNSGTTQNVAYNELVAGKQNYVNRYFAARDASALSAAFRNIVNEISLQSGYYPTRLDDDAPNFGGYITFVDEIGMGMEVKEIEGIVIGNQRYSGLHLAEAIRDGEFGTQDEPTALGDNMVWAVKERLGIADTAVAQRLLNHAFENGQLGYTSSTEWSNYIGWYGDAEGNFLAPWPNVTAPTGAKYINRSYGMLGSTTAAQTTHASDMMYIVIQVSTEIETGHQTVSFRIPAALLPVVTYEIHLNDNNDPDLAKDIDVEHKAANPLSLVYEVGLRSDITPWNITEILPAGYQANADGTYNLYTNHWNTTGANLDEALQDTKNNHFTYAYFEPSEANEHYYFTEDSPVLDANHNPVKTIRSGQTYYFAHRYFKNTSNGVQVAYSYETLSATALASAVADKNGNLYVPEGVMHRNTHSHDLNKTSNTTGTLNWVRKQIVDAKVSGDAAHHYEVIYLGNNGVLNYKPGQGIKLSKTMAQGEESEDKFTFTVALTPNGKTVAASYDTMLVSEDGAVAEGAVTVRNNQLSVSLYAGQRVYILGIEAGIGYTVTENEHRDYRVTQRSGATGTVSAYEFSAVTFTNAIQHYSSLNIVKGVEYRGGAVAPATKTARFPITVTFAMDGAAYAGKTVAVDGVDKTTDQAGKLELTIADGQKITVTNLPVGATYTVTEGTLPTGYKWENPNDAELSGTIEMAEKTAIVLNSYTPEPVELTQTEPKVIVNVDKTLQHADGSAITQWDADGFSFQFNLARFDGQKWNAINTLTMTTPGTLEFNMAGQTFDAVGSYFFRVSETVGSRSGMTYDRTLHIFQVIVTDTDLDGELEISNVRAIQHAEVVKEQNADVWNVTTDFVNTYEPKSTKLALEAIKVLTGRDLIASEFSFELYVTGSTFATDGAIPEIATNGLLGDIIFTPITYTSAGDYFYVMKEVKGAQGVGITYSEAVYEIQVTVDNVSDQLVLSEILVNGNPVEVDDLKDTLTFENSYDSEMKTPVVLEGTKTLSGRDITAGDNFRFTIESKDGSYSETVSCGTDGKFSFKALSFDAAGDFTYYITEEEGSLGGVTYDEKIHTVIITVTDNGKGELIASYSVDGVANGEITFVNVYEAEMKTPVVIEGTKTLAGRDLNAGEFSFELWRADEYGVEGKTPRRTVINDENGYFSFAPMTFTTTGEWNYIVVETQGSLGGVTYDNTVYQVKITVTDNGEGELQGVVAVDGDAAKTIAFKNTYKAEPVSIALTGKKILTGRMLNEGEFTFRLTAVGNAPMPAQTTVSNGLDGQITFAAVEYTAVGAYRYKMQEVHNGIEGIIYDNAEYELTVTVTDDGNGNLVATVKALHTGTNVETPVVEFFNKYTANSVDVTVKGTKTLIGRELADGEFRFVLKDENGQILQTATNVGGEFAFGPMNFHAAGEFRFTVEEDKTDPAEGVLYDETVYPVTVEVIDGQNGQLKATVNGGTEEEFSADFRNVYVSEMLTPVIIEGVKIMDGRKLEAGEFSFELWWSSEYGVEGMSPIQTVTHDENGKFGFTPLTFTEAGEWEFIVVETIADRGGVIYDHTGYIVSILVEDNGEGKLVSTVTVEGEEDTPIVFRNYYVAEQTEVVIEGNKTLEGRPMAEGEFTFELWHADEYGVEGMSPIQTVTHDESGNFAFDPLIFATTGERAYVVVETRGELNGVTYDETVYYVKIAVADDGEGQLVSTVTVNGKRNGIIEFRNTYEAAPVSVELNGTKILEGRDLVDGEFQFLLKDEAGEVLQAAANTDGAFTFEALTFSAAGTYTYTVEEDRADPLTDVIYDETVYTVIVEVTDGLDGSLYATVNGDAAEQFSAAFVNYYEEQLPQTGDQEGLIVLLAAVAITGLVLLIAIRWGKKKFFEE